VKAIEIRQQMAAIGRAGDNVELGLKDIADASTLTVGQVLCDPAHPVPMVSRFKAQILSLGYKVPILQGTMVRYLISTLVWLDNYDMTHSLTH
jgi:translation elongation factor EF-1alpha